MKLFCVSMSFALLSLISFSACSEPFFVDSFESADMSASNSAGFMWGLNNRTSIVSKDKVVWNNGLRDVAIPVGRDWNPKEGEGQYSLRFRYAAGQSMTEQRFNMGAPKRELWIRFWLRTPINYSHGSTDPTNHKFFSIWMDGYQAKGDGPTVTWEFWNNGSNGSNLAFNYSKGGFSGSGGHQQHASFINYPTDQGRWMQIVIHVKAASSSTSNDGVIETYRRWDRESSYTKLHELLNANIAAPPGGPDGWKSGYIMGWANAAYTQDTEWLFDSFTLSEAALISTAVVPMAPIVTVK